AVQPLVDGLFADAQALGDFAVGQPLQAQRDRLLAALGVAAAAAATSARIVHGPLLREQLGQRAAAGQAAQTEAQRVVDATPGHAVRPGRDRTRGSRGPLAGLLLMAVGPRKYLCHGERGRAHGNHPRRPAAMWLVGHPTLPAIFGPAGPERRGIAYPLIPVPMRKVPR